MSKDKKGGKSAFDVYLSGERLEKLETPSGIPIKEVYTQDDIRGLDYERDLGNPGKYPYTRGVYESMHRGRFWTIRQLIGYGTPEETNERIKFLFKQGQAGFALITDIPTQLGLDPDSPLAIGAVGAAGVSIATEEDLHQCLADIPPDKVSINLVTNPPGAPAILSMYALLAQKRGIALHTLLGTVQNDPYFYPSGGNLESFKFFPLDLRVRLCVDVLQFCCQNLPKVNTFCLCCYNLRDRGVDAVLEGAFAFAAAFELIQLGLDRGLEIDEFAPRISFLSSGNIDFFEEIAKTRAMRRIWARMLKERFAAKNPRSLKFRTHITTAGASLTTQQPYNNIIRATSEVIGAVLAGAQSMQVPGYDEGFAIPTEFSATLSLRVQQVVAYETGVTRTPDPLAGSYFIESLTNDLEERILDKLKQIEERGGATHCIQSGWLDKEVDTARIKKVKEMESGERIIVGVNAFTSEEQHKVEVFENREEEWRETRTRYLRKFKEKRDQAKVSQRLREITRRVKSGEYLIPAVIEAIDAQATLGEVCDEMREAADFKL